MLFFCACYLLPLGGLILMLLQVEDRPIIKEIKTYIREHHPVEKEFVVETRPTGKFAEHS